MQNNQKAKFIKILPATHIVSSTLCHSPNWRQERHLRSADMTSRGPIGPDRLRSAPIGADDLARNEHP